MNDQTIFRQPIKRECVVNKSEIEKILGLPFTGDNYVQLLVSGQTIFQKIIDCLSAARDMICIEFYIFKDDHTGQRISEILKEKANQGVKIYLLYDHFGSFLTSTRFWKDLKKSGIHIRVSHPLRWSTPRGYIYRNHKKLLLIDGRTAMLGGFNIADEYHRFFRKKKMVWRDTGIFLEGPIVSTLMNIFNNSWTTWQGESIPFKANKQPVENGIPVIPVFTNTGRARRKMRRLLLYSIRNARNSIFLTTAYFIPGKKIINALINASKRGVSLKLLLPGESDIKSVLYAGRSYYSKLLKAGIEIYHYHGSVLHSKTAVFDDCWSIIGSTNLDFQSLRRNEESNVGIFDTEFSKQMVKVFQDDMRNSTRIDLDAWLKRPYHQRLLEKMFYVIRKKL